MPSTLVFEEPANPVDGPFVGLAAWYRNAGSPEGRSARADINAWYATFPDLMSSTPGRSRRPKLLSRLRSDNDVEIEQATDELYAHHLLAGSYAARYEEDATSPDFRLYRSSEYIAGIEVLTLFPDSEFTSLQSRNAALVREINRRVPANLWYVGIDVIDWKRQPRVAHVAKWLDETMAALPPPVEGMTVDECPTEVYASSAVELAFRFIPRSRAATPDEPGSIVGFGPPIWGFVQSGHRLRHNLSLKAGKKYEHRGRPYAVLVSVRDISCSSEEIFNALYGDAAIIFPGDDPDATQWIRCRNGTFGLSQSAPEGRNRRVSCVFALMRGWAPGSAEEPTIVRYDNPFALQAFPDDVLVPTSRFAAVRDGSDVRMELRAGAAQ